MAEYRRTPEFGEIQENEIEVYTVAIGNLSINPFKLRRQRRILEFIGTFEGLLGVYPHYPDGTLLLFKEKNDAKGARNLLKAKGIQVGNNIGTAYIDKEYVKEQDNE